jgi:hypothetical protein
MSANAMPALPDAGRLNKLSVVAVILAAVAAAGMTTFGIGVLAVFAVGAGHVSLNQIKLCGCRGRGLAVMALAVGYGLGTLALINAFAYSWSLLHATAI